MSSYVRTEEIRDKVRGENAPNWAGDKVGYQGVHIWIRKVLGTPNHCEHCASLDKKKYEWANVSGEYRRDVNDFIRLCTSCHHKYDMTDEKRRIIGLAKLGNTYRRRPILATNLNGDVSEFVSITEASVKLGVLQSAISNCLKGTTKMSAGYKWKYKEEL